ncbi:MAG: UDP-N-acetylmuramate dehydrogenase [Clostridia bacterium]|nr:UDP-N-acetylmuramate dehydrogenase [Clostridia bacterium]
MSSLTTLAKELQKNLTFPVKTNEPLSRYTTWRVGGPADLFVQPLKQEELSFCLDFANRKGLPVYIMGNGSNLLVKDGGVRGLVIQTKNLCKINVDGQNIQADCGVLLPRLLQVVTENGLGGLEFAAGIPATIGGAVVMNAGTPAGCLGDVVKGVEVLTLDGERKLLNRKDINFSYRNSSIKQEGIVVSVNLELPFTDSGFSREKIKEILARRHSTQPIKWSNAGSIFKNPPEHYAGQLIEKVGAKGWRVGEAEVSEKHANFIINRGQAKASDVLELISKIQDAVYDQFGIKLELEIEVWGEGL